MAPVSNSVLNDACETFVACSAARGYMDEIKMELCFSNSSMSLKEPTCFKPPSGSSNQTFTMNWLESSVFDRYGISQNCFIHEKSKTLYCRDQVFSLEDTVYLIARHVIQFFASFNIQRTQLNRKAAKGLVSLPKYEEKSIYYKYLVDGSLQMLDEACEEDWKYSIHLSSFLNPLKVKSPTHFFLETQLDGRMDEIRLEWLELAEPSYCSKRPGDAYSCFSFSKSSLEELKTEEDKAKDVADWLYAFKNNQIPYSSNFTRKVRQLLKNPEQTNNRVSKINELWDELAANGTLGYDLLGSPLTGSEE